MLGEYVGSISTEYVWLGDTPVAIIVNNGTITEIYYVHPDHLDTPRYLTDSVGTIVWRWDGDAFGRGLADGDPDSNSQDVVMNLRFPGQQFDEETGLYYNYYRYYDPNLGRYMQSDPIGLSAGMNTYAYVEGNPLRYSDPFGLEKLNLLAPGSAAAIHFNNMPDELGTLLIGAHSKGDDHRNYVADLRDEKKFLTPSELADLVNNPNSSPWMEGMPIKLLACEGAEGGGESFGNKLKGELPGNPKVSAPEEFVLWDMRSNSPPKQISGTHVLGTTVPHPWSISPMKFTTF